MTKRTENEEYTEWKAEQALAWLRYIRRERLAAVAIQDEIETLRSLALRAQDTTSQRVSTSPAVDAVAKAAYELIELTDEYAAQLAALQDIQMDAHLRLMGLEDRRYVAVLVPYYIGGHTWEEVGEIAHYEPKTCERLRTEALPYVWEVMPADHRDPIPRADA